MSDDTMRETVRRARELRAFVSPEPDNWDEHNALIAAGLCNDELPALCDDNEQLRADLARVTAERDRLLKREEHFASVLRVTDRGQYRADWDSAIRRVVAERDALRAIVERLVPHEDGNAHSHARTGTWDSDNRDNLRDKPCQRCHAFADARSALGASRWPPRTYTSVRPVPADPCGASCGCGGDHE